MVNQNSHAAGSTTANHAARAVGAGGYRDIRWRRLLAIGAIISLAVHVGILIYLSMQYRWHPGHAGESGGALEFTIMAEESLSDADAEFEDLMPDDIAEFSAIETSDITSDLDADVSAADVAVGDVGARPRLGGAGAGSGDSPSLGGGGGGATFFGISSRGTRFAYIVDRSSSMERQQRLVVARGELIRSLRNLPDYAQFFVVFYSTDILLPPMQRSAWLNARPSIVSRFGRWLDGVTPEGGTEPSDAFIMLFSLDVRPDVIFFLTDGEIPGGTAQEVRTLNSSGKKVVINTISFGGNASQDTLRQIAADSGGTWRHVDSGNM
ncbi:MAG: VWA domain-containing protein [Phycisphaerales bacterium]|nr:VWA domain-containing protein [Phycisphaerales bacterium]